jgi:hypothetical protein
LHAFPAAAYAVALLGRAGINYLAVGATAILASHVISSFGTGKPSHILLLCIISQSPRDVKKKIDFY